jgi:hypothetical protein
MEFLPRSFGTLYLLLLILNVHIKKSERMRRDYRVYEKVELRIYKNDFKSTTIPQIEVLVDFFFL